MTDSGVSDMRVPDGGGRTEPAAPLGSASSSFPAIAPVDEATWGDWARGLPQLVFEGRRVVVVAPHPDDETMGSGALVHELAGSGVDVQVVTVTDGEGSHRSWPDLAATRRAEQVEALRALGVIASPVYLGLPDGAVSDHADELETSLGVLVAGADAVVATWDRDGHADHDAVGRAAVRVAASAGISLFAHPIWSWQWATVDDVNDVPWQRWDLSPSSRRAKAKAMSCYRSQISDRHGTPVLPSEVLARAARRYEVYARVG